MTDSASQSLVDLDLLIAVCEKAARSSFAVTIDPVPVFPVVKAAAARITELEAERDRLANELDVSNNNHRAMAHQMAELGARCLHAESELSRVEAETIERCAPTGAIECDVRGFPKLGTYVADAIRSLPPLAKRGDQKSRERSNPPAEQSTTLPQPLTEN